MMLLRLHSDPVTHDYRKSFWGHALHGMKTVPVYSRPTFWQRLRGVKPEHISNDLTCQGHGDVREGDFILTLMASGKVAKWKAEEVERYRDPDDMFNLRRASFVEYVEGE